MPMKGLTWNSLKHNISLLPLFFIVGVGVGGATLYSLRVAARNPEVSVNRKGNPEPWNEFRNKQYKFKQEDAKCVAPEY